jgi:hypothetical protein
MNWGRRQSSSGGRLNRPTGDATVGAENPQSPMSCKPSSYPVASTDRGALFSLFENILGENIEFSTFGVHMVLMERASRAEPSSTLRKAKS